MKASCFVVVAVFFVGCSNQPSGSKTQTGDLVDSKPEILASTENAPKDWCAGHDVPESKCTKCNPSLLAGFQEAGDWCEEHEFPESVCPVCNPQVEPGEHHEAVADWCAGHGVPESKCTKCNPSLLAGFQEAGDWCEEHEFPESVCPVCNPQVEPGEHHEAVADWCAGHSVPESKCTKCNPSLLAGFQEAGDWCEEHEFPESVCPVCNPQVGPGESQGAQGDWCLEHGLPESQCTKCNTSLIDGYQAQGDWCKEHGFPESVCPICSPSQPPVGAEKSAIEARIVRFRSEAIEEAAGIRTVAAVRADSETSIECAARIAFNSNLTAEVRALVPGVVKKILIEPGDKVGSGENLFQLESAAVGEAQGQVQAARERTRTAKANMDRLNGLKEDGIVSAREVEIAGQELAAAKAELGSAKATLEMTGAASTSPNGRYNLTAPISGTVVLRPAVVGILATEDTSLATIVDTSAMWVLCDIPESQSGKLRLDQKIRIQVAGYNGSLIEGRITWIAPTVNPRTRTVVARAEVPNPEGLLKENQFAQAWISTDGQRGAVTVPRESVQRIGALEVVFVRIENGVYEPRVVRRQGSGKTVQVEGNLKEGALIVTTGAVLLRTEVLPGSIGAGCCEVGPRGVS